MRYAMWSLNIRVGILRLELYSARSAWRAHVPSRPWMSQQVAGASYATRPRSLRNFCWSAPHHNARKDIKDERSIQPPQKPPVIAPSENKAKLSDAYTIPNMLTISRIAATPFIGYFLATGHTTPALSIFAYSCITDFVDGYIARKYNMKTVLGSILDPAADKFLMTTCTVALAIQTSMPLYVAACIIGRDVFLSFYGFYVRYRALPPPKTLKRFLDLSIPTHSVHPNLLGKVNTALQMAYIGTLVILPLLSDFGLAPYLDLAGAGVAATTVVSGLTYIFLRSFKPL